MLQQIAMTFANFSAIVDAERGQEPFAAIRGQHSRQRRLRSCTAVISCCGCDCNCDCDCGWGCPLCGFSCHFMRYLLLPQQQHQEEGAAATSPFLLHTTMWQVARRPTSRFVFLCFWCCTTWRMSDLCLWLVASACKEIMYPPCCVTLEYEFNCKKMRNWLLCCIQVAEEELTE